MSAAGSEIDLTDAYDQHHDEQGFKDLGKGGDREAGQESRREDGKLSKQDKELAIRLSSLIEGANNQLLPICKMIRRHIDSIDARKDDDKDENELVKNVKPLLEEAEKILNETNGAIKGADPDNRLSNRSKRNVADHKAEPEEQRLAEALKLIVEVGGTIDFAKDKLNSFPKARRDLGPLLDALGQPLTQIVGGVGLLLTVVLNLLNNILSGLGLDCVLKGIFYAIGLDRIYKGLGLDKWLNIK